MNGAAPLLQAESEGESGGGVRLRNLRAAYGARQVLRGVDLDVPAGGFLAVVGPNGAGKSTLLKAVAGALKPSGGGVFAAGARVSGLSARERAKLVALVPQDPEMPAGASALEVALLGRNPHLGLLSWETRDDVEIALESMRMAQCEDLASRAVETLSGGERQRVAIAMALAQRTPIILLDEPTANLDLAYQPAMMGLMRQQAADGGKTIVAAMHDLTLAAQFCDAVAMLSGGEILALGEPAEALTPANIRAAYGAEALVLPHPRTGKPVVVGA